MLISWEMYPSILAVVPQPPIRNLHDRNEVLLYKSRCLSVIVVGSAVLWRVRQAQEKLMLGTLYKDMGLVFATPKGTP